MATIVKMPQRGLSEESALLAEWHVKIGDQVSVGDLLFVIETDKTTFEVESEVSGTVLKLLYKEYDEVPVQEAVCIIGAEDEALNLSEYQQEAISNEVNSNTPVTPDEETIDEALIEGKSNDFDAIIVQDNINTKAKISPRAKALALKKSIDYRQAKASGPEGRIIERDIISMLESGPFVSSAARDGYYGLEIGNGLDSGLETGLGTGLGQRITTADLERQDESLKKVPEKPFMNPSDDNLVEKKFESIKLSQTRKVISKNMLKSLETTAQLTLNVSFDATALLAYRQQVKDRNESMNLSNISINDMILFAVSRTVKNHKALNAHLLGDEMHLYEHVHLGVAVDTDRGLMVPTLSYCDMKSLDVISKELRVLAAECREGTINPDHLRGGTFTVTNLGSLGIESFTPILNAPQTGILGVGTIVNMPKEVQGKIVLYPSMFLSLTMDHRALDGAAAARFLKELRENLEKFSLLLAM